MQQRNVIKQAFLMDNLLAIAVGDEGLDLYLQNSDGTLRFLKNLNKDDFGLEELDIRDVKMDDDLLMVLDQTGVYFFYLRENKQEKFNKTVFFY